MNPGVPDSRFSAAQTLSVLLLTLFSAQTFASTISDLMIVVDADGHHYTAQQALFTQGELTVVTLPSDRKQLHVEFGGPNSLVFTRAHERNPNRLSLWSGTVFSRFRHQFSHTPQELENTSGLRRANLGGLELTLANSSQLSYSVTWVLPDGAELVKLIPANTNENLANGMWASTDNLITYRQFGGMPKELEVEFRLKSTPVARADSCAEQLIATDECRPDIDADGVPDYRDVCLPADVSISASKPQATAEGDNSIDTNLRFAGSIAESESIQNNDNSNTQTADSLGCSNEDAVVLEEIEFESDNAYLSAKVRTVLDRVALAIQENQGKLFEIAAHTDHTGRAEYNKNLSDNRAIAIRHYLMLRGVGPNQIRARGYGETMPVQGEELSGEQTTNRRVELRRLD